MTRSAQRAAPGPRLQPLAAPPVLGALPLAALMLGALLLGAVTMLSPGRPTESHAMEDVSASRCVASAGAPGAAVRGGAHHTPAAPPQTWGPVQEPAPEPAQAARTALSPAGAGPGSGRPAVPAASAARDLLLRPAVLRI
ncbi:hypothetical protein [Streptomyces virginiae]|uniref:hypothetical protein n=1 Tax=Streptomyces virginiae TaxID=1961 RepID=UPI0034552451